MPNRKSKYKERYEKALKFLEGDQKIERNFAEAKKLLELNHEQGHSPSSYFLGYMLCVGLGGSYDKEKGIKICKKKAEKAYEYFIKRQEVGDDWALFALGLMHYEGHGVKKDHAIAFDLFKQSAHNTNSYAENALGLAYLSKKHHYRYEDENEHEDWRDEDDPPLNFAETPDFNPISADDNLAFAYFFQSATRGNPLGLTNAGACYGYGWGIPKTDHSKAYDFFNIAANKHNFPRAQTKLGYMYQMGFSVKQSLEKASKYYEMAIAQDYPHAMVLMSSLYFNELQVFEKTGQKATDLQKWTLDLLQRASAIGLGDASYNLGYLYENGIGFEKNQETAVLSYKKAARAHYPPAMFYLGVIYEEINQKFALEYYQNAARLSNLQAQWRLTQVYESGDLAEKDLEMVKYYYQQILKNRFRTPEDVEKAEQGLNQIEEKLKYGW